MPLSPIFIVNTLSQTVLKKGSVLTSLAADYGAKVFSDDVFNRLPNIIEHCLNVPRPWVIIEGGDGTAQGILTALLKRRDEFDVFPVVTLLPGGMTNQVAKNIGLKKREDIKPLLDKNLTAQQSTEHYVPLVRVSSGASPDFYGFLFSTGAIPMITNYTKSKLHQRGIGGSIAVLGGIWRGVTGGNDEVMHRTPITIDIDIDTDIDTDTDTDIGGQHISEDHLSTVITTLPSLILGIDPFWGKGAGALRVTMAGESSRRLLPNVLSIWRGNKTKDRSSDGLQSWNAREVRYVYDGPIVLDGEFLELSSGPITVTATKPILFRTLK